mmetsp:Transcript_62808/g.147318  ORF Transcript_62808/g.147318 Transcript_62808/m.147318 type:complete len:102 (+) Transcript_62808:477-782(+)
MTLGARWCLPLCFSLFSQVATAWLHGDSKKHDKHFLFREAYDTLEFFAGKAWITKAMQVFGRKTASFDIGITLESWQPGKQNAMDLLTPSGMALQCCQSAV